MEEPDEMPSADIDADAHFECVVKARKARRSKAGPSDSRDLRKCVRQVQRASTESGTKNDTLRQAFGRSSWTRPKGELATSAEATTDASSRGLPQASVVASDPHDCVGPGRLTCESAPTNDTTTEGAFGFSINQPMSSLLAEYGEQDLEWEKMEISNAQSSCNADESDRLDGNPPELTSQLYESRLGRHGKAPIHLEFVSFGYHHGAPKEARAGWSHGNPLPLLDTRELISAVPPYMAWQDGLSGSVKFALLRTDGAKIRNMANDLAESTSRAIISAIEEGGYGYVAPLHMHVFVASDSGRHRSVVVAEMAATALRNILRKNDGNRFGCPCSVSTKHLHLERRQRSGERGGNAGSKTKQKELEDD